ncbi:hypothetical protein D9758_010890 [Tetrapyrgos nigripes]|uniref:Centrosomin N-terminal motif 1 domain-containing protein n=1 Tax=Tetrapyrgos nigripes TaxID=182062 RepID=A0A8H5FTP6_9AGAR|nr:hypothetical protein D9758_010890 [Tetrapyrgos nigripes]
MAFPDSSLHSIANGDFSLASLPPDMSTPPRPSARVPSSSSQTTAPSSVAISTPSPPASSLGFGFRRNKNKGDATGIGVISSSSLSRRYSSEEGADADADADESLGVGLDTPAAEKSLKWGEGISSLDTPVASRTNSAVKSKSGANRTKTTPGSKGTTLTLRDQEKHIDSLNKENFNLKLRVHFLEERLASLAPEEMDAALKQNISLKIETHSRGREIKRLKKLLLELERELERLQNQRTSSAGVAAVSRNRERELEEKLEEREREIRELRRRRSSTGTGADAAALREAEERNVELEEQLENAKSLLEDNLAEIERLQDIVERQEANGNLSTDGDKSRRVNALREENTDLLNQLDDHRQAFSQLEDERADLLDEIESLRLTIDQLNQKLEADSVERNHERSESRLMMLEEREEREGLEDDMNALKDRLAATLIELQQREDEIERKDRAVEELMGDHEKMVAQVEDEWRGEVEEARQREEELRDVLLERETESKDLRLHISELEAGTNNLHDKFEAALAHLEQDSEAKDQEIESLNQAMEKLSEQIYNLEDDNDRLKEESDRIREEEEAERDRLEALAAALKEKLSSLKSQLEEMTDAYETCSQEIHAHRSRQEELASHVESLVTELERERLSRERLENELDEADKEHDIQLRSERRALEAKESALQSSLNDLARSQSLLNQREEDLDQVQQALQTLEAESKKAGETHSTARFSLQLEVDRLKRDLERLEDELSRARKELDDKESKSRDRDGALDKLHAENRDLASQLAAQTQARLNISEKLDSVQASLKAAEGEIGGFKSKIAELEMRLSKDQRSLLSAESQYRDQLTERNTLLLTIYQYMDKILGVDKTPKKGGQAETKPFTNFSVFHDNLITRLKALSQIQLDFDKRSKEIEGRFTEKLNDMRKQLENRWKQIDKFETSVKAYAETKTAWRRKFSAKEGELEALKTTNNELAAQLSGMKRPGQADPMELRSASTRAVNAERRLNNAQNQLLATEEKIATLNQKSVLADAKWEARVKEYEARLKAAEEKVKRERQGGKERALELENQLKSLQRQLELAQKRSRQLSEVIDFNDVNGSPNSTSSK